MRTAVFLEGGGLAPAFSEGSVQNAPDGAGPSLSSILGLVDDFSVYDTDRLLAAALRDISYISFLPKRRKDYPFNLISRSILLESDVN
jgi:hypothetical protein